MSEAEALLPTNSLVWKFGDNSDADNLHLMDHVANILHSNLVQKGAWPEQRRFGSNFATSEAHMQKKYFQTISGWLY